MKNKILKILGVLALATLSMNTMAWKVNYGKNSNQQIEMLDSEILVANNLEFVNDKALGTAEFQSARYYEETTDSEGNKREAYVVTSSGKKINCLMLKNGENRLCLNIDSMSGVNKFLVQKLEDFIDKENLSNFDSAFINRIRSVIASYHIAETLDIDSETWKNAEGNKSSAFIEAALNVALPNIADSDASKSVQGKIKEIKNQIVGDLFGSNPDKIDEAFNAVMLFNICGNKCHYNPKAVLIQFFKAEENRDLNGNEIKSLNSVRDPFLQHCGKHITPMNMIKTELESKLNRLLDISERINVLNNEIAPISGKITELENKRKDVRRTREEKNSIKDEIKQKRNQISGKLAELAQLRSKKNAIEIGDPNQKKLEIFQDASKPFTVITFDEDDLRVTKYEDAPKGMQNFINLLVNGGVLDEVKMKFENNSFQIYAPSTTENDGVEKIPVISNGINEFEKLRITNYKIQEAKLNGNDKLNALDNAHELSRNTETNLFFKFVIPISIKTSIRNTEYGSCFFILLNQAS